MDKFYLSPEDGNEHDPHAVSILKDGAIVGHAPRELSRVFFFFLRHDGTITAEITGHRRFSCGLEVPCLYTLTGKPKYIKKAKKLLLGRKKTQVYTQYVLINSISLLSIIISKFIHSTFIR